MTLSTTYFSFDSLNLGWEKNSSRENRCVYLYVNNSKDNDELYACKLSKQHPYSEFSFGLCVTQLYEVSHFIVIYGSGNYGHVEHR